MRVVPLADTQRLEKWKSAASFLRELADRCEAGDLTDLAIVYHDKTEQTFNSWGEFEDRWRLLGALEYAKTCIK